MNKRGFASLSYQDLAVIVVLSMVGSLLLVKSLQSETKWFFFLLVLLAGASFILILPTTRRYLFLLFALIFFVPVHLDYHPIYYELPIVMPMVGFTIAMWEFPFLYLFIGWIIRQIFTVRPSVDLFPMVSIPFLLVWIIALSGMGRCLYPDVIKFSLLWKFLECWLVVICFGNILNNKDKTLLFVSYAFLSTILIQVLVGFLQQFAGGLLGLEIFGEHAGFVSQRAGFYEMGRVGGTLGSPNSLSVYLISILPLGFALLFSPIKPHIKKLFILPVCILGVFLLIITYSRAGWVGLLIGSGLTIFLCRVRVTKQAFGTFLALAISILIFVMSLIAFVEPVRHRLFEDDNKAAQTRIPMAQVAAAMIYSHPLWGVGLGNYTSVANYYDTTKEGITYTFPWPVHNEFLLVASELGLPALGLLFFILLYIVIKLLQVGRSSVESTTPYIALGLIGSIVGYCINRLFDFDNIFITIEVWSRVGLAMAVIRLHRMNALAEDEEIIRGGADGAAVC